MKGISAYRYCTWYGWFSGCMVESATDPRNDNLEHIVLWTELTLEEASGRIWP